MKLSVSTSAKVHVLVAAVIAAVVAVVLPAVEHGGVDAVTTELAKAVIGAAVGAALRTIALYVPASPAE